MAPVGRVKRGPMLKVELKMKNGHGVSEELMPGQLHRVELGTDDTCKATMVPAKGIDIGAGPGVPVERELRGGISGLVFDARGRRPIPLPETQKDRVASSVQWNEELELYPS